MILQKGKLNIGPIDATWGSSGKSKIADFIASHEHMDFAISHNSHNASHITVFDDGTSYKFNCLPSSVVNKGVKVVIGADAVIQLPKLLEEIDHWKLNEKNIFIHPNVALIKEEHIKWEKENLGEIGSTMTGGGAAKSWKILRKNTYTAAECPQLKPFVANVHRLVNDWLREGQCGILETAQGYDLSLDTIYDDPDSETGVGRFFPFVTSRNINATYFAGMSFVPYQLLGHVFLNLRSLPIRVGDKSTAKGEIVCKFKDGSERSYSKTDIVSFHKDGIHLEIVASNITSELSGWLITFNGKDRIFESTIKLGSSGHGYPNQKELSWKEVTLLSGSSKNILEETSLTLRTRRVFERSVAQLKNSTMACMPTHISINFTNYIDAAIEGKCGEMTLNELNKRFPKVGEYVNWVEKNQYWYGTQYQAKIWFLGTGAKRSEAIILSERQ